MSRVMVDEKFMRNEEPVTGALDAVKAMRVVEFTTSGSMGDARQQGVVGQSLTENAPLRGPREARAAPRRGDSGAGRRQARREEEG